ncbi:MAG TPA: hypothetical protein VMT29_22255 [Steroidobacteraceae bacterium]|nr:hypothetical protein [Steroidobacteraceae bacterium]
MNGLEIVTLVIFGVLLCYTGLINIFDHDRAWDSAIKKDGKIRLLGPLIRDQNWEQATTECGIIMLGFGVLVLLLVYSLI